MTERIRPKHILLAIVVYSLGFTAWGLLSHSSAHALQRVFRASSLGGLCWYAMGTMVARRISRTHAPRSQMRWAWNLMAGSAAAAAARHVFQIVGWALGAWDDPRVQVVGGFRQVPIVLSLLLLVASLICMWLRFRTVGIGRHLQWTDILLILSGLSLIPLILSRYAVIGDAAAILSVARYLQYATPFLIILSATLGVLLYRVSEQMGGGEFSKCLRVMTAFLFLRLVGHLLIVFPGAIAGLAVEIPRRLIWSSVDGIFVLALAYRWEIRRLADEAIARYQEQALDFALRSEADAVLWTPKP